MKQIRRSVKYVLLYLLLMLPSTLSAGQQPSVPEFIAVEPKTGVTTPGTKVMVYGSGFSLDSVVYFGGLEARETKFLSSSMIEVVTPYLRPGAYQLQLKSGEVTVRSEVSFTATPSPIDSEIDRAVTLAGQRQAPAAIAILQNIAKTSSDYQVRAFAHYQSGQVYFALGDWWRWGGEVGGIFETEAGRAPQTSWQYRLAYDESVYLLPIDSDPETALRLADWTVKYDVTDNPEPRFFRALVNARYGHLVKAKTDSDSILKLEPDNQSYQALAAYIAVLSREKRQLRSISRESIKDARALSLLGQAAYLSGDLTGAQLWWTQEAKTYPLGASLAYWAGKKHVARGQQRVAEALLAECVAVAPDSKEAKEAEGLLAKSRAPTS